MLQNITLGSNANGTLGVIANGTDLMVAASNGTPATGNHVVRPECQPHRGRRAERASR